VVATDLDGDGKPDVAAILPRAGAVVVMLADAARRATYPVGPSPGAIVAGDFNGDGRPDLAVSLTTTNSVAILPNIGGGRFGAPVTSTAWNEPTSLVATDLDGDGILDLAGNGSAGQGDPRIWTLRGVGDGTFGDLQGAVDGAAAAWGVATADFNGDGVPDLATTDGSVPGHAIVLLGRGGGSFRSPMLYPVPFGPIAVVAGDFDGDGHMDLATVDYGDSPRPGHVSFLFGTHRGRFTSAVTEPAPLSPTTAIAGDFNGDGRDDLAVSQQGSFGDRNDVAVYLGNRSRSPRFAGSFMPGFGGGAMAAADLNGDGRLDLACAFDGYDRGGIAFAFGRGDGTFVAAATFDVGQNTPVDVAIGDLNGDGIQDVVTSGSAGVSVMLGDRKDGFGRPVVYPVPHRCCELALADVNGDGVPDVVVPADKAVEVLVGRGDGTLSDPVAYPTHGRSGAIGVGDVNGDGHPDLVVASYYNQHVAVLLGNGDGTFGRAKRFATDAFPFSPVVADLNGDGNPDIAVACQRSGTVSLLFGDGKGDFTHSTSVAVGPQPTGVRAADLNADGKMDLVVTDLDGIVVLLGNGEGTFRPPVTYPPDSLFAGFAISDVNGDGVPDVVVANGDEASLLVYLGRGDGTFRPVHAYPGIGEMARGLAAADLNHDGSVDFVVTQEAYPGSILLVLQQR
jgi:FG-GAP-like repeat/FG-GAP repeat